MTQFTIATINAGPMKTLDGRVDLGLIAAGLAKVLEDAGIAPDIQCLQEVRRLMRTPGISTDTASEIAARMIGHYRAFFAEAYSSDSHPHPKKWQIEQLKGVLQASQGNAIVTRLPHASFPWSAAIEGYPRPLNGPVPIPLPLTEPLLYSTGDRNTEPRVALLGAVLVGGLVVYVLVVHLGTYTGERGDEMTPDRAKEASVKRTAQVDRILGVLRELRAAEQKAGLPSAPVFCAGDFNSEQSSPEIQHLLTNGFSPIGTPTWHPGGTGDIYSHTKHRTLIDHIFLSDPEKRLTCTRYHLLPEKVVGDATDHLPVYATFELK